MSSGQKRSVVEFLHTQMDGYGDSEPDIIKALDYAVSDSPDKGGFVLVSYMDAQMVGVVVVNETGMSGYVPENLLVYIATHKEQRGKGIGRELLVKAIDMANGDIALHVDDNNPAGAMYENMGFQKKYIEMRLIKQ